MTPCASKESIGYIDQSEKIKSLEIEPLKISSKNKAKKPKKLDKEISYTEKYCADRSKEMFSPDTPVKSEGPDTPMKFMIDDNISKLNLVDEEGIGLVGGLGE